jgi:hypothetical protein
VSFGIITPVLSVVISGFMLGLSLGAWAGGRWIGALARRTGLSAVLFYSLAEMLTALVLIESVGVHHTLWVAAPVNCLIAAISTWLGVEQSKVESLPAKEHPANQVIHPDPCVRITDDRSANEYLLLHRLATVAKRET